MRSFQRTKDIFTAKAANGIGIAMEVSDFRHLVLALDTASSAALVINVQGSIQEELPDFAASQAQDNQWTYIQVIDLNNKTAIVGATGITLTGTDIHRMFEINTNGLKWINLIISGYSAGSLWARVKPFNDTH